MQQFVTFEGIDGSGKTTVSQQVYEELSSRGYDVVLTIEPTDTWLGETVNRCIEEHLDPLTIAFTFIADRAQHVKQITEWLKDDKLVLCDRYVDSTLAYQGAQLHGQMEKPMRWLRDLHEPFLIEPDTTFLFKLDVDEALQRIQDRPKLISFERKSFLESVQNNYQELAVEKRFVTLDATQAVEDLTEQCIQHILQ